MMKCAHEFEPGEHHEPSRRRPARRKSRPLRRRHSARLYQQIKALITQGLESGEWKPGEIIPSEVELAARYKVSQGTVRKAIDELAADNLLVRRQGKGTFVATHNEDRVQFRFLRLLPEDGDFHPHVSRLLECRRLRAPAEIARQLDLKPADPVVLYQALAAVRRRNHRLRRNLAARRGFSRADGSSAWRITKVRSTRCSKRNSARA